MSGRGYIQPLFYPNYPLLPVQRGNWQNLPPPHSKDLAHKMSLKPQQILRSNPYHSKDLEVTEILYKRGISQEGLVKCLKVQAED
jgi:hypothetical protein